MGFLDNLPLRKHAKMLGFVLFIVLIGLQLVSLIILPLAGINNVAYPLGYLILDMIAFSGMALGFYLKNNKLLLVSTIFLFCYNVISGIVGMPSNFYFVNSLFSSQYGNYYGSTGWAHGIAYLLIGLIGIAMVGILAISIFGTVMPKQKALFDKISKYALFFIAATYVVCFVLELVYAIGFMSSGQDQAWTEIADPIESLIRCGLFFGLFLAADVLDANKAVA